MAFRKSGGWYDGKPYSHWHYNYDENGKKDGIQIWVNGNDSWSFETYSHGVMNGTKGGYCPNGTKDGLWYEVSNGVLGPYTSYGCGKLNR